MIMETINSWVNCILATIILIGIIEIIVPDGETKKFVLLVTGVVTSIIIASPVIKWFSDDFYLEDVFSVNVAEDSFYYIDTLRSTVNRQSEILEEVFADNVVKEFNEKFLDMKISDCRISFLHDADGKIIEISEVFVICEGKIDDVILLRRRVAEICEISIDKVRVG